MSLMKYLPPFPFPLHCSSLAARVVNVSCLAGFPSSPTTLFVEGWESSGNFEGHPHHIPQDLGQVSSVFEGITFACV